MNKPVIFAALALMCLKSACSFAPTYSISSHQSRMGFAKTNSRQNAKSQSLLTARCSNSAPLSRRLLLTSPFVLPFVASAFDKEASSTTSSLAKDDAKKGKDESSKSAIETKSDNGAKKVANDATDLAMKECDTPAKTEAKKQEICEVDY